MPPKRPKTRPVGNSNPNKLPKTTKKPKPDLDLSFDNCLDGCGTGKQPKVKVRKSGRTLKRVPRPRQAKPMQSPSCKVRSDGGSCEEDMNNSTGTGHCIHCGEGMGSKNWYTREMGGGQNQLAQWGAQGFRPSTAYGGMRNFDDYAAKVDEVDATETAYPVALTKHEKGPFLHLFRLWTDGTIDTRIFKLIQQRYTPCLAKEGCVTRTTQGWSERM